MRIETTRLDLESLDGVSASDITGDILRYLSRAHISEGICVVALSHPCCSLVLTDELDESYEDIIRLGRSHFAGNADEPPGDRLDLPSFATALPVIAVDTLSVPIHAGQIAAGPWEMIVLLDGAGPGLRHVDITVVGD